MQEAFKNGPRETLLYVPAIVPDQSRPDYLAVIDVDPESVTYQHVRTSNFGWDAALLADCR